MGKKIVSLTAENVKRLSAVHIEPGDGPTVLIGGDNGAGKSSVLDSIMFALGGAALIQEQPIRKGETAARIVVDLGDLKIERRFTASGSTVKVMNADGASYSSPQKMLDALFSRLAFDPLAFANMDPVKQGATLRELVGIDFDAIDKKRKEFYDERTVANRLLNRERERLAGFEDPQLTEAEIAAGDPAEELQQIERQISEMEVAKKSQDDVLASLEDLRDSATEWSQKLDAIGVRIDGVGEGAKTDLQIAAEEHERLIAQIKTDQERELRAMTSRHEQELKRAEDAAENQRKRIVATAEQEIAAMTREREELQAKLKETVEYCQAQDAEPLRDFSELEELAKRRAELSELRSRWKSYLSRKAVADDVDAAKREVDVLNGAIEKCDKTKRELLNAAEYPIDGLSVSETGGVLFEGIPFDQASRAQQIRTSVAIGFAMNPKCPIVLIRDGSLLDDANLKTVAEMAERVGGQVWIERVGDRDAAAIVIEDGHIRGVETDTESETTEPAEPATETRKRRTKKTFQDGEE